MIKKIKINSKQSVELDSSMGWLFVYKQQFGHDVLPDLLPVLETILNAIGNIAESIDESDTSAEGIIRSIISGDTLSNALIDLSGFEVTTMLDMIWAMARNKDENTPEPAEWYKQFDKFALNDVLPVVFDLIIKSTSSKNLKSLMAKIKASLSQ